MRDEMEEYYEQKARIRLEEKHLTAEDSMEDTPRAKKETITVKHRRVTEDEAKAFRALYKRNVLSLPHLSVNSLMQLTRAEMIATHSHLLWVSQQHWRNLL